MTAAEYLAVERDAAFRTHAQLISRISHALEGVLDGRRCAVTVPDPRLRVVVNASYLYPDVIVVCGGFSLAEG